MLPPIVTTRPSGSCVALGYQRAKLMFWPADQLLVFGSKMFVAWMPNSPPLWPPMTSTRPSSSSTCAEQKIWASMSGAVMNVFVAGSQTRADGVPPYSQASQTSTLPLLIRLECTATSGQFMTEDQEPVEPTVSVVNVRSVELTSVLPLSRLWT